MRFRNHFLLFPLCIAGIVTLASAPAVADKLPDKMIPLNLRNVKCAGEIGRRVDLTLQKNLLAIDVDESFLQPFHEKSTSNEWEYIGLGKLIDSAVHFAAYSDDPRVLDLKKHLVDEAIACQEPDGYIGIFPQGNRLATLWDIHEMSYLILGMLNDYRSFGEEKSLKAAEQMMDYMLVNWKNAHPWTQAKVGLDYAALQLYMQTGDRGYLDFCKDVRELSAWNKPILIGTPSTDDSGGDGIDGHHAYAYMDQCRAQLELYRLEADESLLHASANLIGFLTQNDGSFITGSCSHGEMWSIDQNGHDRCEETCATAYLIRVLENKLRLEGKSLYGDMMERAIYNALFAAQSVNGRQLRYFTAFEGPREYFPPDISCCPGNFRRILSELPAMIYYKTGTGLSVNLYVQSKAEVQLADVYTPGVAPVRIADGPTLEISQETDYPNSGKVLIRLTPSESAKFPLNLRIPRWCEAASIAINGVDVNEKITRGTFFTIERMWKPGDEIELNLPMKWRLVKGRELQSMKVAVMRGPMLFCFNPALNNTMAEIGLERMIGFNLASATILKQDATVRPDGMGATMQAWVKKESGQIAGVEVLLTEFADPDGETIYFPMQGRYFAGKYYGNKMDKDLAIIVDDELLSPVQ